MGVHLTPPPPLDVRGLIVKSRALERLATSRLANIFGNGMIYGHDNKKLKRAETPEITKYIE